MSSDYQPLQGMHDITGDEVAHWQWLEQQARSLFYRFGYTAVSYTHLTLPTIA